MTRDPIADGFVIWFRRLWLFAVSCSVSAYAHGLLWAFAPLEGRQIEWAEHVACGQLFVAAMSWVIVAFTCAPGYSLASKREIESVDR